MPRRIEQGDHYGPMTEAELRAKVVDLAHSLGWKVFSQAIIKHVRPVKDAVGYPDLTLARGGKVIWIELKREGARLSPEQGAWMDELPRSTFVVRPSDLVSLVMVLA